MTYSCCCHSLVVVPCAGTGFGVCDPVSVMAPFRGFFMARISLQEHS
ncbi:hypothetical protein [Oceanimonas smirnovii]|uniref:Uncharacterized protein n=1 Tax=Oceanimonas smirnovii TaxID=264574 RepID=A0ABW7P0W7_9GAMM